MILVLSGTKDAMEIIRLLKSRSFGVLATTVTEYGSTLSREAGASLSVCGELDDRGIARLIKKHGITAVIDATHPFAAEASKNAMSACTDLKVSYLRYERKPALIQKNPLVHYAENTGNAGEIASKLGNQIFYTAGSRGLETFLKQVRGKRVVARVLPDPEIIKKCSDLGMGPGDIIAMKGPFSEGLNRAMLEECEADVLVTKESGQIGGVETKIAAAMSLEISVIVIKRPKLKYPTVVDDYEDVIEWISKNL